MGLPFRARVDERWFLDMPGLSEEETYVFAYVEDTSECDLRSLPWCDDDCSCCPRNFEPRVLFELGDRTARFRLELCVAGRWRRETLHAMDTLVAALQATRAAVIAEGEEYDRRQRLVE
jgi:hypothetical protein